MTRRALFFDFDGVLTDNKVGVLWDGSEIVFCNKYDSHPIQKMKEYVHLHCLSGEPSPNAGLRCKKLSVPFAQAIHCKEAYLEAWCKQYVVAFRNIAYIGNDMNDLGVLSVVGAAFCPADAHPIIKAVPGITVMETKGGDGVLVEFYLKHFNNWRK